MPRRRTDRVQDAVATVLCALALVATAVAAVVGIAAHRALSERADREAADRVRIEATVASVTGTHVVADGVGPGSRKALVTWVDPRGAARSVELGVPVATRPGGTVPVWTDRTGAPAPAPFSPAAVGVVGVTASAGIALGAAMLLAAVWVLVRRWAARRNAEAWASGWAEVEPGWSGRTPTS